ncbi:conserved hypothetical protein [Azospirillaceae bacterium]
MRRRFSFHFSVLLRGLFGYLVIRLIAVFVVAWVVITPVFAAQRVEALNVRIGTHTDHVRVVLDISSPISPQAQLSDDGLTLTLFLPGVSWKSATQRKITQADPLTEYRFISDEKNGGRMDISAKVPVQILSLTVLPPLKNKSEHRLLLNIAADPSRVASKVAETSIPSSGIRKEEDQDQSAKENDSEDNEKEKKEPDEKTNSSDEKTEQANSEEAAPSPQEALPSSDSKPLVASRPSFLEPLTRATPSSPSSALSGLSTFHPLESSEIPTVNSSASSSKPKASVAVSSSPTLSANARSVESLIQNAKAALDQKPPHFETAYELFRKAADAGHPIGAFGVAQMYRLGLGREINMRLAAFWYGEAARLGHDSSQYNLGLMKMRGIGVERNRIEGLELIRAAARQGNRYAINLLEKIEAQGITAIDRIAQ